MCDKERLIKEVFMRIPLWDSKHRNHQNRYVTAKLWKEIANKLNITGNEASKTWKNLRQEFRKKILKFNPDDLDPNEPYTDWPYFEKLLFLKDQIIPLTSDNNSQQYSRFSSLERKVGGALETSKDVIKEESQQRVLDETSSSMPLDRLTPSISSSHRKRENGIPSPTSFKRKKRKRDISPTIAVGEALLKLETEKLECKKQNCEYDKRDEDVGFFNSIIPHVKNLAPQKKLLFRMKVQQLLYDMSFRNISEEKD